MTSTPSGDDSRDSPADVGGDPSSGGAAPPPTGSADTGGDGEMAVRVNGERRTVPSGLTLSGLLEELGVDGRRVAVERNRKVVPGDRRDEVELEEGDEVEIVQFVGGGR